MKSTLKVFCRFASLSGGTTSVSSAVVSAFKVRQIHTGDLKLVILVATWPGAELYKARTRTG